jgi:hypothetical protein
MRENLPLQEMPIFLDISNNHLVKGKIYEIDSDTIPYEFMRYFSLSAGEARAYFAAKISPLKLDGFPAEYLLTKVETSQRVKPLSKSNLEAMSSSSEFVK